MTLRLVQCTTLHLLFTGLGWAIFGPREGRLGTHGIASHAPIDVKTAAALAIPINDQYPNLSAAIAGQSVLNLCVSSANRLAAPAPSFELLIFHFVDEIFQQQVKWC